MKTIMVLCVIFLVGCTPVKKQQAAAQESVELVEKNARAFNPNFNVDTTNMQAYLTLEVVNGKINPTPKSVEFIPVSKRAFQPHKGDFEITLFDSEKRETDRIYIDNPLLLRSYDTGDGKVSFKYLKKGVINITVPFNEKISSVRFTSDSNKEFVPTEIDLRGAYQKFLKQGPK